MSNTYDFPAGRDEQRVERRALLASLAPFQRASARTSSAQLAATGIAYVATLAGMYAVLQISVWLTLALALPAAGLMVRLFIIQHDCGHGSYFRTPRANEIVGSLCSMATFTPYANWRRQHANHHAVWNNLDRRNSGADIYSTCFTLDEYRNLPVRKRWLYRIARHPIVSQIILPPLVFLFLYRMPFDTPKTWRKERWSVHMTNAGLAAIFAGLVVLFGWKTVLLVHLPIVALASIAGVWLFSVQHRFETAEWVREPQWTSLRAALNGSSYLRLPRILQWFSGNIGFHHIHHLAPRVPNYRLEACHAVLVAQSVPVQTLTLGKALHAPSYALWDEAGGRMVRFPR